MKWKYRVEIPQALMDRWVERERVIRQRISVWLQRGSDRLSRRALRWIWSLLVLGMLLLIAWVLVRSIRRISDSAHVQGIDSVGVRRH